MNRITYFIKQSWLLILSAFCFGLLIAATNATLAPRIAQNEKDKLYNLMSALISDANSFQVELKHLEITGTRQASTTTDIFKATDKKGEAVGFAFIAEGTGFADKIKLVIAVDVKCEKFFGYKVLSSNETPGFGSKIKEDYFRNQFKGTPTGEVKLLKTGNAKKIDSEIVAITGATVSSEAVLQIFNTYMDEIKKYLRKEGLIIND